MILFIEDIRILNQIKQEYDNVVIYNYTSYYSGFENLILAYVNEVANGQRINTFIESLEFDLAYSNLILNNQWYFIDMMKIMIPLYHGANIVLMVFHDPYRDNLMESLIKFISVRYGYRSYIINDIEDLKNIKEPYFTPYGLMQLDNDFKMYEDMRLRGIAPEVIPEINVE